MGFTLIWQKKQKGINIEDTARSYFVARTPCTIYRLYYEQLNKFIADEPALSTILSQSIAAHFHSVIGHIHESREEYTHVRLSRFLLKLSRQIEGEDVLDRHFNYIEIAKYLGVHAVTVARIMSILKKKGAIGKRGHQILILDRAYLEEVASNMRNELFLY